MTHKGYVATANSVPIEYKLNELAFQNEKYAKTKVSGEFCSLKRYENTVLTPIEMGGTSRGALFSMAVAELGRNNDIHKKVLDYACGRGYLGMYLSQKGFDVTGFDISSSAIQVAKECARINGIDVDFEVMDAENLRYPDANFDYAIGFEALHHVIVYPNTILELARVMKSGGKVIFAENWGADNPIFQAWRNITTLRQNSSSTRGEIILGESILRKYRLYSHFKSVKVYPIAFSYMIKKYIKLFSILKILCNFDGYLLKLFPFVKSFFGEAVIVLECK